ncbi:MAG TPA: DUF2207 domain-containing protein [Motilibacterales bacterium]|nr:DUF2207 domain-containing protein [Motilibacterales bacterium]
MSSRALAIGGRIILILLTAVGLLWPLAGSLVTTTSGAPDDPVVITELRSAFTVAADGHMSVTEQITADFPSGRRGIFRYWDVSDPSDPSARHIPTIRDITVDGSAAEYQTYWEDGDRFVVARIGDPDVYLDPGEHTYTITYAIDGVISAPAAGSAGTYESSEGQDVTDPGSVLYWNVVAQGWEMAIQRARIAIALPSPSGAVQCSAGTAGGTGPCGITGAGTADLVLTAEDLPPRTGMTVRATMAEPAPDRAGLPWSVRWDPILGRSVGAVVAVLIASGAAVVAGVVWGRAGREDSPGFPVQYAPPNGLGPVQTVYMATESHGPAPLVATILYLADRGFVSLENPGVDSWRIVGRAQDAQWGVLDPGAQAVGRSLGIRSPGASFAADGSISAGKTLGAAQKALPSAVDSWASSAGLVQVAPNEYLGRVAWVVALLLAALGFAGLSWATMWGLPFAAFAIGGVTLLATGVGRRRTAAGRIVWSQAGGFERLLSTPSAEDRFDFAARKDLFIAYVPYAVAFGVADRWAEKYRVSTQSEPPIPTWYPYYMGSQYANFYTGGQFDSFDSAVSESISAYTASQSSSSSGGGGGGFSGGGGGGGGGSW